MSSFRAKSSAIGPLFGAAVVSALGGCLGLQGLFDPTPSPTPNGSCASHQVQLPAPIFHLDAPATVSADTSFPITAWVYTGSGSWGFSDTAIPTSFQASVDVSAHSITVSGQVTATQESTASGCAIPMLAVLPGAATVRIPAVLPAGTYSVVIASGSYFPQAPAGGNPLAPPGGYPTPSPATVVSVWSPTASVTATNLTGPWLFGQSSEPSPGPVLACNPFEVWDLTQTGTTLHGSVLACMGPCSAFTEETAGTNASGSVTLTGTAKTDPTATGSPVTYSLQFNPATQHLVGTRNSQPFWAAPFIPKPASVCGPAPV